MPPPQNNRPANLSGASAVSINPFHSLGPLIRGAQQVGATPWGFIASIELRFHSGAVVPLPLQALLPQPGQEDEEEWQPTRCQRRIIEALRGGQKKLKKQLKAIPGVGNHVFSALRDLTERGMIDREGEHYLLTDDGEEWGEE